MAPTDHLPTRTPALNFPSGPDSVTTSVSATTSSSLDDAVAVSASE